MTTKTGETPIAMPVIPTSLLIVDDQPKNLFALEAILEPLGVDLVRASSGAEALKFLLTRDFAAILLDVQMPVMDGFETAMMIKERERSRHIPIIFLTAISKEEAFVFRGYTVGAVDYIFKPFDPDILRSKVQVFIDLYRKSEELKIKEKLLREREVADLRRTSERRYRELAESMPQIVWMASADGTLVYGNQRWFEGVTTLDWRAIVHPADLPRFEAGWKTARETVASTRGAAAVVATGAAAPVSSSRAPGARPPAWEGGSLRLKTGTGWRWHLVRAVPTSEDGGTGWVGTCTDIDDRKHAEDALRFLADASTALGSTIEYEKAFADVGRLAVTAGGPCDIFLVDRAGEEGKLERVVAKAVDPYIEEQVWETSRRVPPDASAPHGPGKVVHLSLAELVPNVDDPMKVAMARDAKHLELMRGYEAMSMISAPLVTRSGTYGAVTMISTTSARRYDPGDLESLQDLARRMAAAIEIADLYAAVEAERAKLELAHKAKDEFLATLSHELRTPLNAMLGWAQLLRSGDLEEAEHDRALETIERNAKAQAQLIADLLDVSRIVTGKLHLNVGTVQLPQLVEATIDAMRPSADAKGIALEASVDPFVRDAQGDGTRLTQVLSNLLSNAIKFTPQNGRVRVVLEDDGDTARVTVTDTGQGIDADFLPHVFERFRQADSTSTRTQGGLGLGLAIVRHLVELHGGGVTVRSAGKDQGSTFVVTLPLPPAAEDGGSSNGTGEGEEGERRISDVEAVGSSPRAVDEGSGPVRRPSSPTSARVLGGVHVLLVEDEPDGRGMARVVLERCGASVTAVPSAAAALDALRAKKPDVLVSDIGLPGEDGYALIRKVRSLSEKEGGKVLAVALTAYASEQDRLRALDSGFDAHLTKPVEAEELRALVTKLAHART